MQLLYLWIEDYKNIKRQGFNFSPLYNFEFTPDKPDENGKIVSGTLKDNMKEEEREKKKVFYKDFFGKGISNVTAIVGENGAGKSSVLDFINEVAVYKVRNYIILFEELDTVCINQVFETPIQIQIDKGVERSFTNKMGIIHFSNSLKDFHYYNKTHSFSTTDYFIDVSITSLFQKSTRSSSNRFFLSSDFEYIERKTKYSQSLFLAKNDISIYDLGFIHASFKKMRIIKPTKLDKFIDFSYMLRYEEEEEYYPYEIFDTDNIEYLLYFTIYLQVANYLNSDSLRDHFSKYEADYAKAISTIKSIEKIITSSISRNNSISVFKTILLRIYEHIRNKGYSRNHLSFLENLFSMNRLVKLILSSTYKKDTHSIILDLKSDEYKTFSAEYFSFYKIFNVNFGTKEKIRYLSYGEQAILFQLTSLESIIWRPIKLGNHYLICIDEGELGLHPQWQKQYLKILLETLPKIFPNKQIQLTLTSHSPFLVSDLPKENVIFLRKGKEGERLENGEDAEGKCIVDKNFKEQTFGQNIHTLFANSFFLEKNGGLMGDFAKSKLEKVIEFINTGNPNEVVQDDEMAQAYIDRIGESVLKRPLQKKLFERQIENENKREKIRLLRKMLKDLEE